MAHRIKPLMHAVQPPDFDATADSRSRHSNLPELMQSDKALLTFSDFGDLLVTKRSTTGRFRWA
jgi:hypothetical protein